MSQFCGKKSFKSRSDFIDGYVKEFNASNHEGYMAYYRPDVQIHMATMGVLNIDEFYEWVKEQRLTSTEELQVFWFCFDPEAGIFVDSDTKFRGLPNLPPGQHQFGPTSPGEGPSARMLVMYDLDKTGQIRHLRIAMAPPRD